MFIIKGFLKQKKILGQVRRAVKDYNMIEEGNRIAVGISGKDLYLIRPLIYTQEREIKDFVKSNEIIPIKNPCRANGRTKRQYIKELLYTMTKENRDARDNIFGAIKRSGIDGW